MSIPSTKASTANVDQGTDSISSARADIKQNIDNVNEIIDHLTAFGANKLVIPLGGFVVSTWSGTTGYDSAQDKNLYFRMALLGGAYYLRDATLTSSPSLTSATSSYGSIEGASVTTATPSLVEPTGYSWGGTNTGGNITNGFFNNTGNINYFDLTGDGGTVSGNGGQKYIGYGDGYDSYVTLPAGTYALQIKFAEDTITSTYTSKTNTEANSDSYISNDFDIWIYNKTDGVDILNTADLTNPTYNAISQIDRWRYDGIVVFTLAGTKDIQLFNPAVGSPIDMDATNPGIKDFLTFRLDVAQQTNLTGDIDNQSLTIKSPYKNGEGLPGKYGWVDEVPNAYVVFQKL